MQDLGWLWVEEFLNGDRSAFDRIFHAYKNLVMNLAFHFVKQKEVAEDIAQEVFLKIYQKKVKVDPTARFTTWLYRVTTNACIDFLRRKKFSFSSLDREKEGEKGGKKSLLEMLEDKKSRNAGEALPEEEFRILVHKFIEELPEKLKIPILLYQFEEMPYREIAVILGITEKAVERRIYHAKEALRLKLSEVLGK